MEKIEDVIQKYLKKYEGGDKEKEDLYKILGAMMMLIIQLEEKNGIYQEDGIVGELKKVMKDIGI